ncbi:MAG: hypothetical protein KKB70_07310 [Proteobacteria bacterium]|nr:hypothetical protein [Pseudomonadota bacterium]
MDKDQITELFDINGNPIGALLTAQAWLEIKPLLVDSFAQKSTPHVSEPLDDWELLKTYWDFGYPVDTDVTCGTCKSSTANWAEDHPRLFRLTAASLSGLVTFTCLACESKIIKKHFKDELVVETHPPTSKDSRKEARY